MFLAALAGCRPLLEEPNGLNIFATSPDGSRFAAAMPEYEMVRPSDNRSRIVVWVGNRDQYYGDDSESRIVWTSEAAAPLYLFWIDDRTLEIVIAPGTSVNPGSIRLRPSEEVTILTVLASEIALDSICDSTSLTEIPVSVDDSRSKAE